jgi:nicotinamide-nucleotide amidase
LLALQQTVAVAESCTGGKLGAALTAISGASDFFYGGVVTYSNEMKTVLLDIDRELIGRIGAVSEEVAVAMACNVRCIACSDYGIGITGIAGPTGGTPEKPVGLVYIAISDDDGETVYKHYFSGDRALIRDRAVIVSLDLLRRKMLT